MNHKKRYYFIGFVFMASMLVAQSTSKPLMQKVITLAEYYTLNVTGSILPVELITFQAQNTEGVLSLPISTANLPSGTYFLKVSDGQTAVQQKVIKN